MFWLLIAAAISVGVLFWNLSRRFSARRLHDFNESRRAASRIVSLGEFVDGNRTLAVALALTDLAFYYENTDMQASLDLQWIEEVDYDSALASGRSTEGGQVLRLRCMRQVFEFILRDDVVAAWKGVMPARRSIYLAPPAVTGGLAPEFA